jgi:hypothetical protein
MEEVVIQNVKNKCVTTKSRLWHLFALYEFDSSRDLVHDYMHLLSLYMFKKYVKVLKDMCHEQKAYLENAMVKITFKNF